MGQLRILYRDETLVAVDKPSGLLVHRTGIDAGETRFAMQMLRDQLGRHVYPIHRLDKGASGALLFALHRQVHAAVAALFARGEVEKRYVAIVRGHPPEVGEIDHPLAVLDDSASPLETTAAQPARTRFRRLATFEVPVRVDRYPTSRYALVELSPGTGRRHQIRRHLKHISHPIIGDSTYGKGRHNRLFAERFGLARLLLACTRLELSHPYSRERLRIDAPLAPEFAAVIAELGRA